LLSDVVPVYFFYGLALVISVFAGIKGSRRWFFFTGFPAVGLILFIEFLAMVLEGSKVGR